MAAAFELSFAGLPFRIPAPDLRAKVEAHLRFGEVVDVLNPNPLPEQWYGWLPDGPGAPIPRLYEFFYPWGARRFGVFRGLMHKDEVAALAALVSPSSGPADSAGYQPRAADFVMTTGPADVPISTKLFLLPPRPLTGLDVPVTSQTTATLTDLYLVTLVDERYVWRWKDVTIQSTPSSPGDGPVQLKWQHTWATVFDALKAALGITLDYGTVDPAYGKPDPNSPLNQFRGPAGPSLDYAAANTGRVICRNFDGTYAAQKYADANTAAETAHQAAVRTMGGQLWTAAGAFANDSSEPLAPSLNRPASVVVVSGHWDAKAARNRTYDPTGPTDDRTDFLDGEALGATYPLTSYPAKGFVPSSFAVLREEGTNPPTDGTLQPRLGKDYYEWNARSLDATCRGLVAFDPKAGLDAVYTYDAPATRVYRGEFNLEYVRFSHWDGTQVIEYPRTATLQVVSVTGIGVTKCRIVNPTDSGWPLDREYGDVYVTSPSLFGGLVTSDPQWLAFPPGESFHATFHGVTGGVAYYRASGLLQSRNLATPTGSVTPDGFPLYPGLFGGLVTSAHQYLGQGTKFVGALGFLSQSDQENVLGRNYHGIVGYGGTDVSPPPYPYNQSAPGVGGPTGGIIVGGNAAAGTERQMALPQAVICGGIVFGRPDQPVSQVFDGLAASIYFDGFSLRVSPSPYGGPAMAFGPSPWDTVGTGFGSNSSTAYGMAVSGWLAAGGYATLKDAAGTANPHPLFPSSGPWINGRTRWVPSFYGLSPPGSGDPHFGVPIPPPETYKGGMLFINGLYVGGDIPPPQYIPAGTNRLISFRTRSY